MHLSAAGLFKYVWPFIGHQSLKGYKKYQEAKKDWIYFVLSLLNLFFQRNYGAAATVPLTDALEETVASRTARKIARDVRVSDSL